MNLKKKLLLLCAAAGIACSANSVNAFSVAEGDMFGNWYFAGTGAIGWRTDDCFGPACREYDLGWGVTGAVGTHINCNFRGEFEVGYRRSQLDQAVVEGVGSADVGGHAYDFTLMGNLFYDIPINCAFKMYIGAGAGVSFWDLEAATNRSDDIAFAWQIMPGLSYDITDHLTFTTGYRFFSTTKVKSGPGTDSSDVPIVHSIEWGLRYTF